MDSKTKTMLGIIGVIVIVIALSENADASTIPKFSEYLSIIAQGQIELMHQNSALIDQQHMIIDELKITNQLLMGNSNIFVAGVTDRFDIMEYRNEGSCTYYDRLEKVVQITGCPITGLTKNQFNSLITGNPEN